MQEQTHKVAVYGTLKIGGRFHQRFLMDNNATCLGEGETMPEFKMFNLGSYPGAIKGDKKLAVEVYEVSDKTLKEYLDALEMHPIMYTREIVDITLNNGTKEKAWIYIKNGNLNNLAEITETDEKGRVTWINA